MHYFWLWCKENPALAWPLISSLVIMCFKPRTKEQYNAMASQRPTWFWPRFTAFLQFIGALGLDPIKATQVVFKVITGKDKPT